MAGLYLHVPFCKQACHYCDFHFSTNAKLKQPVLQAMVQEVTLQGTYLNNASVTSIYLGGGTPSLLNGQEIDLLISHVTRHFSISPAAEITLEANPDDVTYEKVGTWRSLGINRLSIGVQSFQDKVLRYFNRAHDSDTAIKSMAIARQAGFDNLSIDLIYAVPGMPDRLWTLDLDQAMRLQPPHIAAYCLTIEPRTVFGHWKKIGKLKPIAETRAVQQFEQLQQTLQQHGYEQYEVSNFSKPGQHAQHNTGYWQGNPYLGIGPSAHSYNGTSRQHNVANNKAYIEAIQAGKLPCQAEVLSRKDCINEHIMNGLRTKWGCDLGVLRHQYGYDLQTVAKDYLRQLIAHKVAKLTQSKLLLTPKGLLIADQVAAELFIA